MVLTLVKTLWAATFPNTGVAGETCREDETRTSPPTPSLLRTILLSSGSYMKLLCKFDFEDFCY